MILGRSLLELKFAFMDRIIPRNNGNLEANVNESCLPRVLVASSGYLAFQVQRAFIYSGIALYLNITS